MLISRPRSLALITPPDFPGASAAGVAAPGPARDDAHATEPAGLDAAALASLGALDPTGASGLLERVLKAYQSSAARLMPQLDAAHRAGDHNAIRLVAHTLKSSSASIGALRLSQLCAQIEAAIRQGAAGSLDAEIAAIGGALDAALLAIERLLAERHG